MKRLNFSLPEETRAQLEALAAHHGGNASEAIRIAVRLYWTLRQRSDTKALILDLDMDLEGVAIEAVARLWQRECGEPERDVWTEIDELAARVAALEER